MPWADNEAYVLKYKEVLQWEDSYGDEAKWTMTKRVRFVGQPGDHENEVARVVGEVLLKTSHVVFALQEAPHVLAKQWPQAAADEETSERGDQHMVFAEQAFEEGELRSASGYASSAVLRTLVRFANEYGQHGGQYHSPYTALVGPSGIGKSFCIQQLAKRLGIYVVYVSLAAAGSSAVPGASPAKTRLDQVHNLADNLAEAETFWKRYIRLGIELVRSAQDHGVSAGQLFEIQSSRQFHDAQVRLANLLGASFWEPGETTTPQPQTQSQTSTAMEKQSSAQRRQMAAERTAELARRRRLVLDDIVSSTTHGQGRQGGGNSSNSGTDGGGPFRFRGLRHVLDEVHAELALQKISLFGVLLGTTSWVTDLVPPAIYDPSSRLPQPVTLLPPIRKMPTWDIVYMNTPVLRGFIDRCCLPLQQYPAIQVDLGSDKERTAWCHFLYTLGRPLWGSLHAVICRRSLTDDCGGQDEGDCNYDYDDAQYRTAINRANSQVYRLAATKLLVSDREPASLLALLSLRVAFDVQEKHLAETLVSRQMHHVVNVSKDRLTVRITQPSEPILVRAALERLWDRRVRPMAVATLLDYYSRGALNAGDMGERVAALLFLFAADVHSIRCAEPTTVSLQDWLQTLLPRPGDAPPADWTAPTLRIHLTHFSRLCAKDGQLSASLLQTAFLTGQGWFLEKNCPGADLLIPLWDTRSKRLSALLVQVKNRLGLGHRHVTPTLHANAAADIARAKAHIPVLHDMLVYGLYMNLRPVAPSSSSPNAAASSVLPPSAVRWGRLDSKHNIKVGVVIGFGKELFPVLDATSLPDASGASTPRAEMPVEQVLSEILSWSDTGFVYENDEDVRSLLWTRDTTSFVSCQDE